MNSRFAALAFAMLAAVTCAAAQPKLAIPEGFNLDFGNVYTGKNFVKHLTIRNVGTLPLELTNVSASCGCTGTLMQHNVIAPNDSTTLTITFDPARFAGAVEKSITMNTNDTSQSHIRVIFKANVVKALAFSPDYLVFKTALGSTALDTLLLQNMGATPVHLLSTTASEHNVTVKPATDVLAGGETINILVTFTPKEAGAAKGTVTITTDHPNMPVISFRYFALVTTKTSP